MKDSPKYKLIPCENEIGLRLDKFLSKRITDLSRTRIQEIIKEGLVKSSKQIIKNRSYTVKNEIYEINIGEPKESNIIASNIPLEIVFEDKSLIVVNKPAGMTVHPGAGTFQDTLVNALMYHTKDNLSSVGGKLRPGIVHRLDKDTSGLLLVAKTDKAHLSLSKQLSERAIERIYKALCFGKPTPLAGKVDINIIRSRKDRTKMTVSRFAGKNAITNFKTIETYGNNLISMVECKLETGRTHQIRVHMKYFGHELIGDKVYGNCNKLNFNDIDENLFNLIKNFPRQCLHSERIAFIHPLTNKKMEFVSELPADINNLIIELKKL